MPSLTTWELRAHNTATHSGNKIHDDEVARRFGFGGGLVPGVDLYAYLTHPPAEAWGLESHLFGWRAQRIARDCPSSLLIVKKGTAASTPTRSAP